MPIIRGPFTLSWGDNVIVDVEELDVEFIKDSEIFNTIQGRALEIDGNMQISATITLLAADIPALAAILPQHFVANGEVMSTGETVDSAEGAIDIVPRACDEDLVYNNLDIVACGNPGQVHRVVNARTVFVDPDFTEKLVKVQVKFIGEAEDGVALLQFFKENEIGIVS